MSGWIDGGLNESGEDNLARIFDRGALHHARGARTSSHAHYAWKVHVGLDAPVWATSESTRIEARDGARVLIVPPGVEHQTGAIGWSLAFFFAPGSWATGLRATGPVMGLGGAEAAAIVDACRWLNPASACETVEVASEVASQLRPMLGAKAAVDARVALALRELDLQPSQGLAHLGRVAGLSLDRLSRLVARDTGLNLRRHVLWRRVLCFLQADGQYRTIAQAAHAAGFSDHAHLTRTFRQFLGRAPSEFRGPPLVTGNW